MPEIPSASAPPTRGALIINRKVEQGVVLELPDGRKVTVRVIRTGYGKVRLGFTADRDIPIFRSELLERAGGRILPRPGDPAA